MSLIFRSAYWRKRRWDEVARWTDRQFGLIAPTWTPPHTHTHYLTHTISSTHTHTWAASVLCLGCMNNCQTGFAGREVHFTGGLAGCWGIRGPRGLQDPAGLPKVETALKSSMNEQMDEWTIGTWIAKQRKVIGQVSMGQTNVRKILIEM